MNHFAVAGLVGNIDGDRLAFFQAQQRTRHLAVIGNRLDGFARRNLECIGSDVDGVIGGSELLAESGQSRGSYGHAGKFKHLSPGSQASS